MAHVANGTRQLPTVVVILGPTAVGKSALSLDLAREVGGEIINADSMQLYRGMDVGTAKLPAEQRRGVPHHLLDVWDVGHTATVAEYQLLARARVREVALRGNIPILVGGSGLYINAAIDDMKFPGVDPVIRARWEQRLDAIGPAALHAELAAKDPAAATRIEPLNGRRIVRALEVIELTNAPYPADLGVPSGLYPSVIVGLNRDRAELDKRIEARIDDMLTAGFVDEVVDLLKIGLASAPTASRALGYSQLAAHLRGDTSLDEARATTIVATRRYVRKQLSWFLRDQRIRWFSAPETADATSTIIRDIESAARGIE
ncbi:MAG: tRNA (adenosine(37)-N6)-dimethylallyltransferase MiaA [Actinobacteria bacterium]|nr:tRNA (adenosine(37)-N6)-dimethylallyltransferase MiaA [Actinomycetota bacterium]